MIKYIKKALFLTIGALCFLNMQCSGNDPVSEISDNLLVGVWVDPIYNEDTTTFRRSTSLPNEDYGLFFKANGKLIVRSSGWCGTPPLTFFDANGEWNLDDTLLNISQESFPSNYSWRIISLTEDELIVKNELTDREKDHRALMDVFDEIYELSISVTCSDSSDWSFVAYGAKACGGPQGYIAYSKNIDVEAFLQKVEAYTNLEKAFNEKWSIFSTCDLPAQPKSVSCSNGYPILNY